MNAELVFQLLEKKQVEAVLVGGLAAVAHGAVYMTNDIDLCYDPAPSNLTRLVRAGTDPSASPCGAHDRRSIPDSTLPMGRAHIAGGGVADVADRCRAVGPDANPGIGSYADVCAASVPLEIYGVRMNTLDLPGLIASKRTAARPKDLMALPHIEMTLRVREEKQARLHGFQAPENTAGLPKTDAQSDTPSSE